MPERPEAVGLSTADIRATIILTCDVLEKLAQLSTKTVIDDKLVHLIRDCCVDEHQWADIEAIVAEIQAALTREPGVQPDDKPLAAAQAKAATVGVSPEMWVMLVELVMSILQAWRNRKNVAGSVPTFGPPTSAPPAAASGATPAKAFEPGEKSGPIVP